MKFHEEGEDVVDLKSLSIMRTCSGRRHVRVWLSGEMLGDRLHPAAGG